MGNEKYMEIMERVKKVYESKDIKEVAERIEKIRRISDRARARKEIDYMEDMSIFVKMVEASDEMIKKLKKERK